MPTLPKAKSMKLCPKCKEYLEVNRFSNNQANTDGLAAYCKGCYAIIQRKYRENMQNVDPVYRKKVAEIQLRLLHLTTAKNALKRSNYLKNDIEETIEKVVKALSTNQVELLYENLLQILEFDIKVQEEKYDKL